MTLTDWLIHVLGGHTDEDVEELLDEQWEDIVMDKVTSVGEAYKHVASNINTKRAGIRGQLEDVSNILDVQTTERGRIILGEESENEVRMSLDATKQILDELYNEVAESAQMCDDMTPSQGDSIGE